MLGSWDFAHFQREANVVVNIHVRVKTVRLEHHRDVTVFWFKLIHALAVDDDVTLSDVFEASNHAHGCRLAAARWPEEDKKLLISDR